MSPARPGTWERALSPGLGLASRGRGGRARNSASRISIATQLVGTGAYRAYAGVGRVSAERRVLARRGWAGEKLVVLSIRCWKRYGKARKKYFNRDLLRCDLSL